MPLELNALETARFGITAARLIDAQAPVGRINAAAQSMGVQLVTARVETSDLARVHELEGDGYRLMDTLVYYRHDREGNMGFPPQTEGVTIRSATPADAPEVAEVARAAFSGYCGHYHADPRLDRAAADAAYVEWAETSIARLGPQAPAFLAVCGGRIRGFLTLRRNDPDEMEIVLNAVHPSAQRGGLYGQLVRHALHAAADLGARRVAVSTQLTNLAVQRVWVRQGFVLDRSLYTFHKWFSAA